MVRCCFGERVRTRVIDWTRGRRVSVLIGGKNGLLHELLCTPGAVRKIAAELLQRASEAEAGEGGAE